MAQTRGRITGLGTFVPPKVVTNDGLAQRMDTTDKWITQRTGIKQRHWVDPDTSTSDLGAATARAALADAGLSGDDLDMILVATVSADHYFPGTACFVQEKLGFPGLPGHPGHRRAPAVHRVHLRDVDRRSVHPHRVLASRPRSRCRSALKRPGPLDGGP